MGNRAAVKAPARATALALALVLAPWAARGEPVRLEATQTAIGAVHGNNRDSFVDNDRYLEWIDRLNLQLTWGHLAAGLRLDSAVYGTTPSPAGLAANDIAAVVANPSDQRCQLETPQACYDRKVREYESALLNRYRTTVYPSKVFVSVGDPDLQVTLGDFYAQFGRGLTLSVRKVDEFAYDTTIRGGKLDWNWRNARHRFGATVLAGHANPVRIDEISGRRLVAPASWVFPGMPTATTQTFRPDGILGARLEAGGDALVLGAYGSMIARGGLSQLSRSDQIQAVAFRDSHPARQVKVLQTVSTSMSVPRIGDVGAAYLEVAAQRYDSASTLFGDAVTPVPIVGHALYSSVSLGAGRWSGLVEIRHTRRFAPLMANVNTARASEFFGLQYSAPPTTEPVTTDTEMGLFAYCTSGGRARVEHRASDAVVVYGSLGLYRTWSERGGDCAGARGGLADADRNDVWDPLGGVIVTYNQSRSRANLWGGIRIDDMAIAETSAAGQLTTAFYREGYVRYDALHTVNGASSAWAAQMQGTHRARSEPQTDRFAWNEGEHYTGLHWASRVIASLGYEYTTRYDRVLHYFNGSILVRLPRRWLSQDSSLRVFAGQQRGALRCINGVCKVFPDFTGARIELVLRF